jgi:hypothetical protein
VLWGHYHALLQQNIREILSLWTSWKQEDYHHGKELLIQMVLGTFALPKESSIPSEEERAILAEIKKVYKFEIVRYLYFAEDYLSFRVPIKSTKVEVEAWQADFGAYKHLARVTFRRMAQDYRDLNSRRAILFLAGSMDEEDRSFGHQVMRARRMYGYDDTHQTFTEEAVKLAQQSSQVMDYEKACKAFERVKILKAPKKGEEEDKAWGRQVLESIAANPDHLKRDDAFTYLNDSEDPKDKEAILRILLKRAEIDYLMALNAYKGYGIDEAKLLEEKERGRRVLWEIAANSEHSRCAEAINALNSSGNEEDPHLLMNKSLKCLLWRILKNSCTI